MWICQKFSENIVFKNMYFLTQPRASHLLSKCSIYSVSHTSPVLLILSPKNEHRAENVAHSWGACSACAGPGFHPQEWNQQKHTTLSLRLRTCPGSLCLWSSFISRALFSSSPLSSDSLGQVGILSLQQVLVAWEKAPPSLSPFSRWEIWESGN